MYLAFRPILLPCSQAKPLCPSVKRAHTSSYQLFGLSLKIQISEIEFCPSSFAASTLVFSFGF